MSDSWKDPQFAQTYMVNASDVDANWYEHSVNLASFWSLLPDGVKMILDFGCGSGEFTTQLKDKGYEVDGCDGSPAMIELAEKHYKGIDFFVWDGMIACPKPKLYDAIMSKLTLHFIENLGELALNLNSILRPNGNLLISVPHPISTIPKADGAYLEHMHYDTQIGTYGMHITMIHRSVQDYINPFLDGGFVLTGIVEPSIPLPIIEKYKVKKEYAEVPRRLNLRFQKAG